MPRLLPSIEREERNAREAVAAAAAVAEFEPPPPSIILEKSKPDSISVSVSVSKLSASPTKKRSADEASLESDNTEKPKKKITTRSAKACVNCRKRKVRCDVMQRHYPKANGEEGWDCTNCHNDKIDCIVQKRRVSRIKIDGDNSHASIRPQSAVADSRANSASPPTAQSFFDSVNPAKLDRRTSGCSGISDDEGKPHEPHNLYRNAVQSKEIRDYAIQLPNAQRDPIIDLLTSASLGGDLKRTRLADGSSLKHILPAYLKPLPPRMTSIDIDYLFAKGALAIPVDSVRNALLQAYCEFVHPYMPLLELHHCLGVINDSTGQSGQISLLLFQTIMFAGTAFVDKTYLAKAGYTNRKAARKAFFQKARVLYDLDYESDRISLVQSLLLMTYWYECPDDQKDTWHWMGVAISLGHTIGLQRNPANSNMAPAKKKLWKRIWWSCFMRDRLIALGMRRPTRLREAECDVPMLTEEDFEIAVIPQNNTIISPSCNLMRDTRLQRDLAQMCIEKAKLCLCISHVLSAQYSVLVRHQGTQNQEGSTSSAMMLIPKKIEQNAEVAVCDKELQDWIKDLPAACQLPGEIPAGNAGRSVFIQRALLNMVYQTAVSALHRPQVLPGTVSSDKKTASEKEADSAKEIQESSIQKVRAASASITEICEQIHKRGFERYLPTTSVTVLLPAILIHLLYIRSQDDEVKKEAQEGLYTCMVVLEAQRESYASADAAVQFIKAALAKAGLDGALPSWGRNIGGRVVNRGMEAMSPPDELTNEDHAMNGNGVQVDQQDTMEAIQQPNTPESSASQHASAPALAPAYQDHGFSDDFSQYVSFEGVGGMGGQNFGQNFGQNVAGGFDFMNLDNGGDMFGMSVNGCGNGMDQESDFSQWVNDADMIPNWGGDGLEVPNVELGQQILDKV